MLSVDAKSIAKYFQESVTFDFERSKITSLRQVEQRHNDFYALLDRDAFSALLNDCLSHDNQLVDIFKDLFDAEMGFQKFAEAYTRNSPRQFVAHFLNLPKYAYHKSDIAKVFIAINTWMVFFGDKEIEPQWSQCPFCGSSVQNDRCTNKQCKKTTKECMEAVTQLSNMLQLEREGTTTPNPGFWDYIKTGTEFYHEYAQEIGQIRQNRVDKQQAEKNKIVSEKIKQASEVIKEYSTKIEIEAGKESPDFDALLKSLESTPIIIEVLKYNDPKFIEQLAKFKEKITQKKNQLKYEKNKSALQDEFDASCVLLIKHMNIFESELESSVRSVEEIRELLKEADHAYSIITAGITAGLTFAEQEYAEIIDEYTALRSSIINYTDNQEHNAILFRQQDELIKRVNALLIELNGYVAKDDKSSVISQRFINEVETSDEFALYRAERKTQYAEIVNPLRVRLNELQQEENAIKLELFIEETDIFINEINSARPKDKKSSVFLSRWQDIENRYYAIVSNVEFKRRKSLILEESQQLKQLEYEYKTKIKKRNRIIRITSIICAVVLVLGSLTGFLCELSGVTPPMLFPAVCDGFDGQENDTYITVTGVIDNRKNLVISESARLPWSFNGHKVTVIGDGAFKNNTSLETVSLPKTIEKIGSAAFMACGNLKYIKIKSTAPPQIQSDTFDDYSGVFYVPIENYVSYLEDSEWGKMSNKIFPDFDNDNEHGCILFDVDGGQPVENIRSALLNAVVTLPSPQKSGYHFMGWYANNTQFISDETLFVQSIKLKAKWSVINELILSSNCGVNNVEKKVEIAIGEKITLPQNEFTNTGYHFIGWSTNPDNAVEYVDGAQFTMNSEDKFYLYAKWAPNENTLKFNCTIGEGEMASIKVCTGEIVQLPQNIFTKTGCDFVGWATSSDNNEVKYLDAAEYIMGSDSEYTLYAVWRIHTYTVVYNLNGGTNDESNPADYNMESDRIELKSATREGYSFEGWYEEENFINKVQVIEKGTSRDYVLYARWISNVNTLHFNGNGGVGEMSDMSVGSDESVALPACTYTKLGYEFIGWSTSLNGTFAYEDTATYVMGLHAEYTIFAIWQRIDYPIIYNLNGGTNSRNNPTSYHIESEDIELIDASRDGFTFDGWFADSSMTTTKVTSIAHGSIGELTLYAKWAEKKNKLVFDSNGGKGTMSSMDLNTYDSCTLPLCTYSMVGYRFAGWGLSSNGTSVYSDGAFFEMGTSATVTLYAIWSQSAYTIMYNLDGGTNNSNNPTGYNVDSDTIIFANPSRRGYNFKGWYTNAAKTNSISKINSGSTGNVVLYADWAAAQYTVTYDYNGGSGSPNNKTVYFDSTYGSLPSPTRTGYGFDGWYYSNTRIYNSTKVSISNNHTLTAKWSANSYTVYFNYGNGSKGIANKSVKYDSTYGSLPTTSLTGHSFDGWYYNGTRITESTKVKTANNHTLEARFTPINYTVSISASNVTVTVKRLDTNTTVGNGSKVPYGTKLSITYSANDGYQNAWCSPSGTVTVTGNVSISAGAEKIPSCIATGTLITLADGSQKPVEQLTGDEMLLVWNIYTGKFDAAPILFIDSDAETTYDIINLYFSDGTSVQVIYEHAFWDYNLSQWVFLRDDAARYIGHWFNKQGVDSNKNLVNQKVQLVKVEITKEITKAWSPVTYSHLCYYTNGLLSMPGATEGFINIFEIDPDTMKVDEAKMAADIEKYGLFTYDDFAEYIPEEVFYAFNGQYLKVAMGKGILTWDDIFALVERYQEFWQ